MARHNKTNRWDGRLKTRYVALSLAAIYIFSTFFVFPTKAKALSSSDYNAVKLGREWLPDDDVTSLCEGSGEDSFGGGSRTLLSNAVLATEDEGLYTLDEGELMTGNEPTAIVLHYTAWNYSDSTSKAAQIISGMRSRFNSDYPTGRRVQLFITEEGTVYQLTESLSMKPIQTMNDDPSWNDVSIGIELEGLDENEILNNDAQYQALLPVMRELMTTFNIPPSADEAIKTGIFGHHELNTGNEDPGETYLARAKTDLADFTPQQTYSSVGVNCTCSATVDFSGSNEAEIGFNYLRSKGLTVQQAAGVIGNLYEESDGLDPTIEQGGRRISSASEITPGTGYGIAQWTHGDRQRGWLNYAAEQGADPLSLELQLEYLWTELERNTSSPNYGKLELEATQTLEDATWIFMAYYERPGDIVDYGLSETDVIPTSGPPFINYGKRLAWATSVATEFGNNTSQASLGICLIDTSEPDFSANGVRVDGSPPGLHVASNCSGGFTDGALILQEFILDSWQPPVESIGGYFCRPINNCSSEFKDANGFCTNTSTSIHGLGRALDIMISALDPETKIVGDQIRNWLINNSVALGLQRVIWNHKIWTSNQDGWRDYTGSNNHTDHLHIEINEDGANLLTSFYQGRSI